MTIILYNILLLYQQLVVYVMTIFPCTLAEINATMLYLYANIAPLIRTFGSFRKRDTEEERGRSPWSDRGPCTPSPRRMGRLCRKNKGRQEVAEEEEAEGVNSSDAGRTAGAKISSVRLPKKPWPASSIHLPSAHGKNGVPQCRGGGTAE